MISVERKLDVKVIERCKGQDIWWELKVPEDTIGKGYFQSRMYLAEGEAMIAAGLLALIYSPTMNFSDFDFLLKAMLRIAYSTKQWEEGE